MADRNSGHRCEMCGAGGGLVQFGDSRRYRYHCLTCWGQVAEQVVVAYVEGQAGSGRQAAGGAPPATG